MRFKRLTPEKFHKELLVEFSDIKNTLGDYWTLKS